MVKLSRARYQGAPHTGAQAGLPVFMHRRIYRAE
jgi:hypothetical protein